MSTIQTRLLQAPTLTREAIILAAEALIRQYVDIVGRERIHAIGLSFDDVFAQVIYPNHEIELIEDFDLECDSSGLKPLGRFDVLNNRALIGIAAGDPRRAFTCWHEVGGHGVLQGAWLRQQFGQGHVESIVTTDVSISAKTENLLERQANLFAANASAPRWFVREVIARTYKLNLPHIFRYIGPSHYDFDVRGTCQKRRINSFDDFCLSIARDIKHLFWGLSAQSLSYRVKESGLILNSAAPKLLLNRIPSQIPRKAYSGAQRVDRVLAMTR